MGKTPFSAPLKAVMGGLVLLAIIVIGVIGHQHDSYGGTTVTSGTTVTYAGGRGSVAYDVSQCRVAPLATERTKVGTLVAEIPEGYSTVAAQERDYYQYKGIYYEPVFYCGQVAYLAVKKP